MSEKPISPLTKQILTAPERLKYLQLLSVYHSRLSHAFDSVSSGFVAPFFFDGGWLFAQPWGILQLRSSGLSHHQVGSVQHPPASVAPRGGEAQPPCCQASAHPLPLAVDGGTYFHSCRGRRVPKRRSGRTAPSLHQDFQIRRCLAVWLPQKSTDVSEIVFSKPWFTKDSSGQFSQDLQLVPVSPPRCRTGIRVSRPCSPNTASFPQTCALSCSPGGSRAALAQAKSISQLCFSWKPPHRRPCSQTFQLSAAPALLGFANHLPDKCWAGTAGT